MRGIILEFDIKSDSGIIGGDDKIRYEFNLPACRNGLPQEGATVDFEIQEGKAAEVYILKTPLKAKLDWLFWFLFSFRGRISRDQLIIFLTASLLVLPVPATCAVWSGFSVFWELGGLIFSYICLAVLIKRFHDSGTSAGWLGFTLVFAVFVLLIVSRVLNLAFIGTAAMYVLLVLLALAAVFCLYVCFAKGSIGENRYGREPYSCKTIRLK
ncbi:MAG: DUF805 domain-containing protein [Alphaproteobacteria bacterium]|nr:DUF805 domain-containing protein [Alphaproteobacteria bacterium]